MRFSVDQTGRIANSPPLVTPIVRFERPDVLTTFVNENRVGQTAVTS